MLLELAARNYSGMTASVALSDSQPCGLQRIAVLPQGLLGAVSRLLDGAPTSTHN